MQKNEQEQTVPKNRYIVFCKSHNFSPLLVTVVLVIIGLLLAGSVLWGIQTVTNITSKTTDLGLRNIGELATQAAYYTNVQVIANSRDVYGVTVPFTQSNYIYSYDGVIKVGYDFESIEILPDDAEKTVTVRLPEPIVISNDVDEDSLVVYDERKSIFAPLKLDQVNASQASMKEEALATAANNGIYESARTNAELLISSFLTSSLYLKDYSIVFE